MKIYGIGTDIANINRLKKSIINKKFIDRIFNKNEVIRCNKQVNKVNCYSKRFAAKEAFVKALGTGISKGINFNEIIVYNVKSGKPSIRLIGNTKKKVKEIFKNKKFNIFLSLSDDKPFAIATAIISL
ncbi:holo-ACP synthase [Pelagibacteraceae bacterium]|jgi:holo-[acyl-carrier protein] synthase|nr:holo-ACP synthase [Pelagibacteraceae bacterium]|tara:strand:- start:347 stop:730 length:384 start_codon:yes stop_codon:yes gene_type:complete